MAAACGSLQHIFEKPLPENPSLIESISSSWNQSKSLKPIDDSSFTEIFGELHFKENNSVTLSSSSSSSSSSSFSSSSVGASSSSFSSCLPLSSASSSFSSTSSSFFLDAIHQSEIEGVDNNNKDKYERNNKSYSPITSNKNKQDKHSDSLSSRTSDSLSMCTEGLGFESSDDVEDLMNDLRNEDLHHHEQEQEQKQQGRRTRISCRLENRVFFNQDYNSKRSRTKKRASFPPPISCIGRSGKPWVCFKSFREDGRFILKEIRIPTQEFLHACREDGRLMMHVIQSDDEIVDEDEDEDEDDEVYDDDDNDEENNVEEGHDNKHDAKHV